MGAVTEGQSWDHKSVKSVRARTAVQGLPPKPRPEVSVCFRVKGLQGGLTQGSRGAEPIPSPLWRRAATQGITQSSPPLPAPPPTVPSVLCRRRAFLTVRG